jgi:hypothetical protein
MEKELLVWENNRVKNCHIVDQAGCCRSGCLLLIRLAAVYPNYVNCCHTGTRKEHSSNCLKHIGYLYVPPNSTLINSTFCSQSAFICFACTSQQNNCYFCTRIDRLLQSRWSVCHAMLNDTLLKQATFLSLSGHASRTD